MGGGVGAPGGSIRPGSMVDRARLAKLPLPEAGLKCPRCDSTNTKFCYFNNYSLSQPRHFCKTCRRYWTRGGALRNVPVGGGCRRNKKNKGSNSKSSEQQRQQIGISNNPAAIASSASPSSCSADLVAHFPQSSSSQLPPLMAALQNLNHYAAAGGFQGFNLGNINGNDLSDQWRLGNSNNIGGFEGQISNLFPFQSEGGVGVGVGVEGASNTMMGHEQQIGNDQNNNMVKTEENPPVGLNLTKQFFVNSENNQFWSSTSNTTTNGGNQWTGFSGLNSSSTSHLL